MLCPTISRCVSGWNISPFLPVNVLSSNSGNFHSPLQLSLCWILRLQLVDTANTAVVKNSSYICHPLENKVSVFLQIQPSSSSQSHTPKSECQEGCLPEPLLLGASEAKSISLSLPLISFSKLSFQLLTLIISFSLFFLQSFFFHTFLTILPPGLNYFYFFFYFLSTVLGIYNLCMKKNQYLLKCTQNSSYLQQNEIQKQLNIMI